MPPLWIPVLALLGLGGLWRCRRAVRGTTLVAPWCWALASIVIVLLVEGLIALGAAGRWADALRYAAASSTLLPGMSVLGARRPQHRAWQWIVASLWVVLLLPVVEMVATTGSSQLDLHLAWRMFLVLLIAVELANWLLGPRAPAAALLAAGQILLLWPVLSAHQTAAPAWLGWTACGLAVAFGSLRLVPLNTTAAGAAREPLSRVNLLWCWFRNSYGLLWSLRAMERFNSAAARLQWPVRLGWEGLHTSGGEEASSDDEQRQSMERLAPEVASAISIAMAGLLRRFLSREQLRVMEQQGVAGEGAQGDEESLWSGVR